jgi:hypothetical protein|tara:strand:- start:219 stop:581 length:363 start_codon:yes stop_codon:yes gene_type:complete
MADKIKVSKKVYSKEDFNKSVDTSFKTFVDEPEEEATDTVDELFRLYDKLYYEIPLKGENNSHEYLLQKSSELVDFDKSTEEIQPLLDEISELRERLLEAQEDAVNAEETISDLEANATN